MDSKRRDVLKAGGGASVLAVPMVQFDEAAAVNPRGELNSAEAYSLHRQWMKDGADK